MKKKNKSLDLVIVNDQIIIESATLQQKVLDKACVSTVTVSPKDEKYLDADQALDMAHNEEKSTNLAYIQKL